jgi:hypothetical protein
MILLHHLIESHEVEITAGTFIRAGNVAGLFLLTVKDHLSWCCWWEAFYVQYCKMWSGTDWTLLQDIFMVEGQLVVLVM